MARPMPAASSGARPGPVARPSLRRNFAWNLLGGGLFVLGQWGMLMVLARTGDEATAKLHLGQFALGLAIAQPMLQLAGVQLRQIHATDARRRRPPRVYLAARALTTAAFLLVMAALVLGWSRDAQTSWVVLWIALAKGAEAMSDVAYGRFEQRERMALSARSMALRGAGGLVALAAVLARTGSLALACAAWFAVWAAVWLVHDLPLELRRAPDDPPATTTPGALRPALTVLREGVPLGLVTALAALVVNVPRYLIEELVDTRTLGVFAALSYFVSALRMPALAAGGALAPRLARHLAARDSARTQRLLAVLVLACAAPGLAGVAFALVAGGPVLGWMYRPSFASHAGVLALLLAGATVGFAAYAMRVALTAAGVYTAQVPVVLATLAVTTATAWLWIPAAPLWGAAAAVLAGRLVQLLAFAAIYVTRVHRPLTRGARDPDPATRP